jgi:CubicO group peptidase (beta-lactamase class C family)
MSKLRITLTGVLALVILVVAGAGFVYLQHEPIPDLGTQTVVDTRIYDERYAPVIAAVGAELDAHRQSLSAPSIAIAVAINGKLVWADTRGYADIESMRPATRDTLYAIGSVSKPITAALVASLWEQGVLDLDADIRAYVPAFPEKQYSITLRQLLSHQAGIRHYELAWIPPSFSEMARNEQYDSIEQSLDIFKDDPLLFEPDSSFLYSTYGYTLISAAIEGATGRRFLELLQERIFDPVGMPRTSADQGRDVLARRATEYMALMSHRVVLPTPETNASYKWAGGGLVSTPTDLVRFGVAMLNGQLLAEETLDTVFTAREMSDGQLNPQHYGLGWRIGGLLSDRDDDDSEILPLINHGGASIGSATILFLLPEHDVVIAMAANAVGNHGGSGPLTSVAASVARHFLRFQRNEMAPTSATIESDQPARQ